MIAPSFWNPTSLRLVLATSPGRLLTHVRLGLQNTVDRIKSNNIKLCLNQRWIELNEVVIGIIVEPRKYVRHAPHRDGGVPNVDIPPGMRPNYFSSGNQRLVGLSIHVK